MPKTFYNGATRARLNTTPAYRPDQDQHGNPLPNTAASLPSAPEEPEWSCFATARPVNNIYTGSEVIGVSLLHKQAYSPVTRTSPTNNDPKRGV